MRKIFLDRSGYSAFKQNMRQVIDEIRLADVVQVNAIVVGELLSGFDRGRFKDKNRAELREFLQHPAVNVVPLSEETGERYALICNDLRARGKPIPTNDLWIAASVMEQGSLLMTADRHFRAVPQIQSILI